MRIGGIHDWCMAQSGIPRGVVGGAIPQRTLSEITGQRNLRLTEISAVRTGQLLQKCSHALSRWVAKTTDLVNSSASAGLEKPKEVMNDVLNMQKKVSNLDIKAWLKAQSRLQEMLHVSKTVLRLSNTLRIKADAHPVPEWDCHEDAKAMVVNGLAEVAQSLIGDICEQVNTLFDMNTASYPLDEKSILAHRLLSELKGDFELSQKLFQANALPEDIYSKAEVLSQFESAITCLYECLDDLLKKTETKEFKLMVEQTRSAMGELEQQSGSTCLAFYETLSGELEMMERQQAYMQELRASCTWFLKSMSQGYDPNQDILAWVNNMLFLGRKCRFEEESDMAQQNHLARLELPEYNFQMD